MFCSNARVSMDLRLDHRNSTINCLLIYCNATAETMLRSALPIAVIKTLDRKDVS